MWDPFCLKRSSRHLFFNYVPSHVVLSMIYIRKSLSNSWRVEFLIYIIRKRLIHLWNFESAFFLR
ncbi:hypothetical protein HanRHA438_Chr08g0366701 [Helianthus annuus]|nr:hypothetical protein HanRHA438_Chr08g0366701 [Helianthus annuus]